MILDQTVGETVRLTGSYTSLDMARLDRLRVRLLDRANEETFAPLLLDLAGVDEVGARFVGLLALIATKLRKRGRRLTLSNLSPQSREIISLARLSPILDID